ncbi:MAG: DUF4402 domain-containing protein [Alphaproteobacteria bacterium]|nr:DUF4402 domain-containing protein [Alphaproteobacteria bacterium]
MRRWLLFIGALLVLIFSPAEAQAQNYMNAEVLQPLNFGTFIYTGTGASATVTISTTGQSNSSVQPFVVGSCGIILVTTNVTNGQIQYTLANTSVTLQGSNGGTLNITNIALFNAKETPNPVGGIAQLENSIGGTATITSGLLPGTYSGFVGLNIKRGNLTASLNIPISLIILPRLSAEELSPLDFGRMQLVAGMGGRVRINPATGLRTLVDGSVNLDNGTSGQGQFRVTGIANSAITISLPATVTIYHSDGGATMMAENLTRYPSTSNPVIASNGYLDINVGGDLVVSANQPAGHYLGHYVIAVNY